MGGGRVALERYGSLDRASMGWIRYGPLLVALAGGVACSRGGEHRAPAAEADGSEPIPASVRSARDVFGEANWDLDAEPAAVPSLQRIDPATGLTVPLSEEQRAASADPAPSPIEQERIHSGEQTMRPGVSTGETDGPSVAVR
jgi:hypothetical protein